MPHENSGGPKVDSPVIALLFISMGAMVGFVSQLLFYLVSGVDFGFLAHMMGICAIVGVFLWLLFLGDYYRTKRRRANRRQGRSPWGELRTEPPRPYAERLSGFLEHDASPVGVGTASCVPHRSRMRFWCFPGWERSEPSEAKPVWFIRRILVRIHEAVHGAH